MDLTSMEHKFVENYAGDRTEAARLAGYKHPKEMGWRLANRPRVATAIAQKQAAMFAASGRELGKRITVSRNDIINRLDGLSQNAESDSAKVSALRELSLIFGLTPRGSKETDIFAGWSEEELENYRLTGELPLRFGLSLETNGNPNPTASVSPADGSSMGTCQGDRSPTAKT